MLLISARPGMTFSMNVHPHRIAVILVEYAEMCGLDVASTTVEDLHKYPLLVIHEDFFCELYPNHDISETHDPKYLFPLPEFQQRVCSSLGWSEEDAMKFFMAIVEAAIAAGWMKWKFYSIIASELAEAGIPAGG